MIRQEIIKVAISADLFEKYINKRLNQLQSMKLLKSPQLPRIQGNVSKALMHGLSRNYINSSKYLSFMKNIYKSPKTKLINLIGKMKLL